jgi:hypothetical protein
MNSPPKPNRSHPAGNERDEPDMNASSAAAVERMGRDLVAAAKLLGNANGKRESAAALVVPLPALTTALTSLAAATDDLRVDVLWLLRDTQPLLPDGGNGGAVARAARDFSQLAGRLYAGARACESLRDHIEPLLDELAVESVAGNDP